MERFDCHCHIFNIINVGLKAILEHLQSTESTVRAFTENKIDSREDSFQKGQKLKIKLKKIAELIRIFKDDSTKIFAMLDNHYHKQYTLFPLMFDGDFLLDSDSVKEIKYIRELAGGQNQNNLTRNSFKRLGNEDSETILNFLDELIDQIDPGEKNLVKKSGFEKQYEDMQALSQNPEYKDRFVPFLGVDPRRPDIKSYLSQIGPGQLFAGVKVYPPNGFSPMDKVLVGEGSVFEYCHEHQIPIICHCSYGGFATPAKKVAINGMIIPEGKDQPETYAGTYEFSTGLRNGFETMVRERAGVLNNPLIWEQVLKLYPDLILVLSHFGDGNTQWQENILRLMKQYTNLYTDVSCMSSIEEIQPVKAIYEANPDIQDKILYGSDYFLDMFFNDSFNQYFNRMKTVLGQTIFDRLSSDNPIHFMEKWYASSMVS